MLTVPGSRMASSRTCRVAVSYSRSMAGSLRVRRHPGLDDSYQGDDDGSRRTRFAPGMDEELDEVGPIDYLVVEFPPGTEPDGEALMELHALATAGTIKVLDLAFMRCQDDGTVARVDLASAGFDGEFDAVLFEGAATGLLDDSDLADAALALAPGCIAAVVVYENSWAVPFATALRRKGAQLVASGRVPVQALLASLDALDAAS